MVFRNIDKLSYEKNEEGTKYYINGQLPEVLNKKRRRMNQINMQNKRKEPSARDNIVIKKGNLYINGERYESMVISLRLKTSLILATRTRIE